MPTMKAVFFLVLFFSCSFLSNFVLISLFYDMIKHGETFLCSSKSSVSSFFSSYLLILSKDNSKMFYVTKGGFLYCTAVFLFWFSCFLLCTHCTLLYSDIVLWPCFDFAGKFLFMLSMAAGLISYTWIWRSVMKDLAG